MPTKISATMIIAPRYKTSAETRHCKKIRMRRQARLFRPLPFLSLNPGYLTLQYQITQSKNRKEKNKKTKEDLGGGGGRRSCPSKGENKASLWIATSAVSDAALLSLDITPQHRPITRMRWPEAPRHVLTLILRAI